MFLVKLIQLIFWKFKDLFKFIEDKKNGKVKIHLYGIYGIFGLPGHGKTMYLSYTLEELRKKYGDKIYIMTNYHYKDQDFAFESWKQLLKAYDKPLVVGWDEVQNEFTSRDFKNFPIQLLSLLTQIRKGNGLRIYYTAQRYNRVDKVFRELTMSAVECKTRFGRLTVCKEYFWEDYEQLNTTTDVNQKMKIKPIKRISFVQTDRLRDSYDSYKMLESAKSKDYISLEEQHNLSK